MLQTLGRRVLAKRKVEMMIAERIYFAKKFVAIRLQAQFRMKKAKKYTQNLRVNFKATLI
jgi:hypothetical protein